MLLWKPHITHGTIQWGRNLQMWRDNASSSGWKRSREWNYQSIECGDSRYQQNIDTFSFQIPGAVFVLVTALKTLNLMLMIKHPNNTCQITNQNAPYAVFLTMSVPSSQVALLFSEHFCNFLICFALSMRDVYKIQGTIIVLYIFNSDVS
jgi:hypothetical protein